MKVVLALLAACVLTTACVSTNPDKNDCKPTAADVVFIMDDGETADIGIRPDLTAYRDRVTRRALRDLLTQKLRTLYKGPSDRVLFEKMRSAIHVTVKALAVSAPLVHIGVARAAKLPKSGGLELLRRTKLASLRAVQDLKYVIKSEQDVSSAVKEARRMFLRSGRNVQRVVVYLTNYFRNTSSYTPIGLGELKTLPRTSVISVGIGAFVKPSALARIATSKDNVISTKQELIGQREINLIAKKICANIPLGPTLSGKPGPTNSRNTVRLIGGQTKFNGLVEVYQNGYWRKICSRGWTRAGAKVVCKQLGLSGGWFMRNGPYLRKIPMVAGVQCKGTESNLASCLWLQVRPLQVTTKKVVNRTAQIANYCQNVVVFCGPGPKDGYAKP